MNILLFLAGLAALIVGAESLVRGASRLAITAGISPLVVGLTVVAFGTSSPELAVSVGAVLEGKTDIAVGNVVGSNIFNVLFVLGASALIAPLIVHAQIIKQEVPIMMGASVMLIAMIWDGRLSRVESAVLLALLLVYTAFLIAQSRKNTEAVQDEYDAEMPRSRWDSHWAVQAGLVIGGLVLLVYGSEWLVTAAAAFAKSMGVSDLVIALTIVAAGTSMPEVATSVTAALRGERDIAVGNVIGSSTFNILGSLGLCGVVGTAGLTISPSVLAFDAWVMLATAVACVPIFLTGREIARWEGGVFIIYYAAYTAYLVLASQQHDALPMFNDVMLWFVIPITLLTVAVSLIRHHRNGSAA